MSAEAELLRLAASTVREWAAGTSPAPWDHERRFDRVSSGDALFVADVVREYDGAWIAFMGPQVAEPLAEWLTLAAAEVLVSPYWDHRPHPALAVARALLGDTEKATP